jgi:myosin-5
MDKLYSPETRREYARALVWTPHSTTDAGDPRTHVEPHVYETSALAYRGLAVEGQNQSILVSGESGAGKTETVKILMSHLASIQAQTTEGGGDGDVHLNMEFGDSPIVQRVLDSNP